MKRNFAYLLCLCSLFPFFSCANKENNENKLEDVTSDVSNDSPEKFIYQIFYSPTMLENKGPEYGSYDEKMKEKFDELGINKEYNGSPYSKTFNSYLEKVDDLEKKTGDILGFDWDILWETQDSPSNFGLEVTNVETFPAAVVETKWNNGNSKKFFLIKENGDWKILDMVNYSSFSGWETDYLMEAKQIIKENK